jgi:hypothetical protein
MPAPVETVQHGFALQASQAWRVVAFAPPSAESIALSTCMGIQKMDMLQEHDSFVSRALMFTDDDASLGVWQPDHHAARQHDGEAASPEPQTENSRYPQCDGNEHLRDLHKIMHIYDQDLGKSSQEALTPLI